MTVSYEQTKDRLLDAALSHVPFDGWSEATFRAAAAEAESDLPLARSICPRGAVDLAVAYHRRTDAQMLVRLAEEDLSNMRFRDKVARAVRLRLEVVEDKEAVRRGTTLFALPMHAVDGAKLIWGTTDKIWDALGDTSDDINWYTKRATLSGVYSATVLYWLGDDSIDHQATWAFLDRRIDNVMEIEKVKARMRDNPIVSRAMAGPDCLFGRVRRPRKTDRMDMPGRWSPSGN